MGYLLGSFYTPATDTGNDTMATVVVEATGDVTTDIAAGTYVDNISFETAINQTINAGTSPGGIDLIDALGITANIVRDLILNKTFDVVTTIYFSGIVAPVTIKVYTR